MRIAVAVILALSTACGGQPSLRDGGTAGAIDGGGGHDGGPAAADGGTTVTDAGVVITPAQPLTVSFTGPTIPPGRELTFCVVRRLENPSPALVRGIESAMSRGSHHLILYRTDETEERAAPFACDPFIETVRGRAVPLHIAQVREQRLDLPEGVVYELGPQQMVRIEAHYFNVTESALTPDVRVTLHTIADAPGLERADFLFFGTPDIELTASPSVQTVGPRFIGEGFPAGAKIFAMTAHTHQWGTQFRVQRSRSRTDPGTPLYEYPSWSWDEPPLKRFEPAIELAAGEGVRFTCEYVNRSGRPVSFGESAEDEMCFLWLYYYPSSGYRICIDTDYYNAGQVCCPGHLACGLLSSF